MIERDADLDSATTLRRGILRLWRRLQLERPESTIGAVPLSLLGHLIRYGRLSVGELAALGRARPQSLTRPLAALEAKGLLARAPDPQDARRVLVDITPEGREVVAAEMRPRDRWLAGALGALTPAERGLLALAADLFDRMTEDMDAAALRARAEGWLHDAAEPEGSLV